MKYFISLAALSILTWGCSEKQANLPSAEKPRREPPKMYEYSELAAVMESVYTFHKALKDSITGNKPLPEIPDWNYALLHSEATNPKELQGDYQLLVEKFSSEMAKIAHSEHEKQIAAFNASVQACLQCHQTRCQGPIPRIKKLLIAAN